MTIVNPPVCPDCGGEDDALKPPDITDNGDDGDGNGNDNGNDNGTGTG